MEVQHGPLSAESNPGKLGEDPNPEQGDDNGKSKRQNRPTQLWSILGGEGHCGSLTAGCGAQVCGRDVSATTSDEEVTVFPLGGTKMVD
jgi:hypothetical protein